MFKKISDKQLKIGIFTFSMIFLVLLGLMINYNYNLFENYNLLFDADTARVIEDASSIGASHYRGTVHPLFVMIVEPLVFLLKGIFQNRMISLIVLSSLVSAISVLLIYLILQKIKDDKKVNLLLSSIYLFSFSNIIFTTGIETYNFAALFLLALFYFYVKKENKELTKTSYIILILLGITSFSITITNCIIYGIILLMLLIKKELTLKQAIIIGLITMTSVLGLNIVQKMVWNNTPLLWKLKVNEEASAFGNFLSIDNIKNIITYDYCNSLISPNIRLKVRYGFIYNQQNYIILFNNSNVLLKLLMIAFYSIMIYLIINNRKENKEINATLLLSLGFNTILHIYYGNSSSFLYSLHFLYIIILLFGINLLSEKNQKIKDGIIKFLWIFLIIEGITNSYILGKILKIISEVISKNYLLANIGLPMMLIIEIFLIAFITGGCIGIYKIYKRIMKNKKKDNKALLSLSILGIVYLFILAFISIESPKETNRFLGKNLSGNSGEIVPKTKIEYMTKEFNEKFRDELKSLKEYEVEYNEFKTSHNVTETGSANWHDFYYFGLGNRKKLVYLEGKLVDIEAKVDLYTFNEKQHMIVPNRYAVLIECNDGSFIKIYEDEEGVHFNEEIIKGTETYIDLYDFSKEKYPNMKKVVYGEMLFNIKNSTIYPNIIVYDHPWYRDAAITAMALKRTNNLDLIKDWVMSITEIYDKQNSGIEEADNLGELLYLLSTQEERNEELIDKIEDEAARIASENPDGYYLYGKTDFGDQYYYQNLWYKLGIEAVGREYNFDLKSIPEDSYSYMAWWSDTKPTELTAEPSMEFPYLTYAMVHNTKEGSIPMNKNLYPLSWEIGASNAKYDNYKAIQPVLQETRMSPLHSWAASELLLLLLDE